MNFSIKKPEDCTSCVFGEEGGYDCSLLGGEPCYQENYDKPRPEWCPFDNDGKTITRENVTVVEEQQEIDALLKEQEAVVPLTIDDAVSELIDRHNKRLKKQETD